MPLAIAFLRPQTPIAKALLPPSRFDIAVKSRDSKIKSPLDMLTTSVGPRGGG